MEPQKNRRAPNPYAARVILEPTSELHAFTMRPGGGFATRPEDSRAQPSAAPRLKNADYYQYQ
jgi:hypothetical protein